MIREAAACRSRPGKRAREHREDVLGSYVALPGRESWRMGKSGQLPALYSSYLERLMGTSCAAPGQAFLASPRQAATVSSTGQSIDSRQLIASKPERRSRGW